MQYKYFFKSVLFLLGASILQFSISGNLLYAKDEPEPVFCMGGGYLDAGRNHSGGVLQFEYKCRKYFWDRLRPKLTFTIPEFSAFFVGLGMEWEWKLTEKISLTPSFSPGFYFQGNGRNLGFPFEFRSAIELTYSFNKSSIGIQAFHISNAHLGYKNPGMNAYILFFAVPICH